MQPLTSATSAGVTLSFGILSLIVSVHGAVGEDDSRAMKIVCTHDHAPTPVKSTLSCPACSNADSTTFARAKAVAEGFVVIPAEVIEKEKDASATFKKQISLTVHPSSEVTGVLMPSGKSYYLSMKTPNQASNDTYTLLGKLVASRPDLAFMCKFTLRSATSLFQLVVAGEGTLVLRQMAEADLVREHPKVVFSDLDPRSVELVSLVAQQQLTPFIVAEHGSGKSNIIAEYASSQTPVAPVAIDAPATVATSGNVMDLNAALEAMLAPVAPVAPVKAPRKRRAPAAVKAPVAQAS